MKKIVFCLALIGFCFTFAFAQPRMIEKKTEKPDPAVYSQASFKTIYQGGMFGFNNKEEGTLKFDDANLKIVFFDKNNKERFAIPYKTINTLTPSQTSSQSTTGQVMQRVPVPGAGIAGMFMKEKKRFMVVNFDDTEMNSRGTINFKLETQELVETVIRTLGEKAEMQPRGDSYYRPATSKTTNSSN